ncbi:hypothetical protein CHK_0795 [Christensenella hongkongensis]|uniref:Uncharacterized protein n=1 Tax=Christensenella hongkongensis TaxID=270498 RepID=A0A0M2NGG4_9FIRM|nr:hypothetical protein CHK_0795 [Christensenella hongkongensis]
MILLDRIAATETKNDYITAGREGLDACHIRMIRQRLLVFIIHISRAGEKDIFAENEF